MQERSCNHCCRWKALSITQLECVFVALGIQLAMRMRHNVICGLPRSTTYFHIISYTSRFSTEVMENKMCVPIFSTTFSEIVFISRRSERDMIKNVHWSSCRVPFILVRLRWSLNFIESFSKNAQISNFMKIRPVRAELFHADRQTERDFGRTDMTKLIVAFRNFANVYKSVSRYLVFWPKVEPITSRTQVKSVTTCAYLLTACIQILLQPNEIWMDLIFYFKLAIEKWIIRLQTRSF